MNENSYVDGLHIKNIRKNLGRKLSNNPKEKYTKDLLKEVPKIWQENPEIDHARIKKDNILEVNNISKIYKVSEKKFFSYKHIQAVKEVSFKFRIHILNHLKTSINSNKWNQ